MSGRTELKITRRAWETGFLILCAVVFVGKLMRGFPGNQWDFRLYYYAARGWAEGVNPYVLGNLPKALDDGFFAFTYPPYVLPLFWPFTLLPMPAASLAFLAIKLVLLGILIVIWSRILRIPVTTPSWVIFLMLAYSSTIFVDLAAGNVVTLEQLLLWIGLSCLLKGQYSAFVASTVAASLFKLTPIVLLVMCLWIPDRRRFTYLASGIGSFVAIVLLTYLISSQLTGDFFRYVSSLNEVNPALLPLLRDVFALVARQYAIIMPGTALAALYISIVAIILASAWRTTKSIDPQAENRLELILHLVLLTFVITAPRLKLYAYMLAIVPTYFVAVHATRIPRALPMLVIGCLATNNWMTTPENTALFWAYFSWLIAVGAWLVLTYELRHGGLTTPRDMKS